MVDFQEIFENKDGFQNVPNRAKRPFEKWWKKVFCGTYPLEDYLVPRGVKKFC